MSVNSDVKELALGFFDAINAHTVCEDGMYTISIPEKYSRFFDSNQIVMTFDASHSSKYNCELITNGSKTLSVIIELCCGMGPVVARTAESHEKTTIRYHFFVHFSGRSNMFAVDHADVDLADNLPDRLASKDRSDTNTAHIHEQHKCMDTSIKDGSNTALGWIIPKSITTTYTTAINVIKKRYRDERDRFIKTANVAFSRDLEMFTSQHELRMREMDTEINEKYKHSSDPARAREYRFEIVEQMQAMEKKKKCMVEALQKKHQITISYQLVACEVICT